MEYFFVLILATTKVLALLTRDPIILGRSIWSFWHLECLNPSIISDSIGIHRWLRKMSEEQEEQEQESYSYRRGYLQSLRNIVITFIWLYCTILYCTVLFYCTVLYCTVIGHAKRSKFWPWPQSAPKACPARPKWVKIVYYLQFNYL